MIRAFNLKMKDYSEDVHIETDDSVAVPPLEEPPSNEGVEMIELDLCTADSDALMSILEASDHGDLRDVLTTDPDEDEEQDEIQSSLSSSYLNVPRTTSSGVSACVSTTPASEASATQPTEIRPSYQMSTTLRDSCKAHDTQLVISDGLNSIDVSAEFLQLKEVTITNVSTFYL